MSGFLNELKVQRWDDHRYYHHSKVNQSLHFVSATSFLCAYVMAFSDPAMAALIGWLVAMTTRQVGHLFFEPRGYDQVNQATDDYKEEIKVGYNIKRKLVLLAVWAASPLLLVLDPTLLGIFVPHADTAEFVRHVGEVWLVVGLAGIAFRAIQLFVLKDFQTGLVWATKIATDPVPRHQALPPRAAPSPGGQAGGGRGLPPDARSPVRGDRRGTSRRGLKGGRLAGGCRRGRPGASRAGAGPTAWASISRRMRRLMARSVPSAPVSHQPSRRMASAAARKRSATASKSASLKFRLKTSRPVPTQLKARPWALR